MHTTELLERQKEFARKSARAWQNYFDASGVLPDISLSPEQLSVVQQDEDHLLINGSAGSGKSLTLLYKLFKVMEQEAEPKRILYCSYNQTLIEDARKRIRQSPKYSENLGKHTIHLKTFHNAATDILREMGFLNAEYKKMSLKNIKRMENTITGRAMVLVKNYMETEEYKQLPQEQKLFKTQDGRFLRDEVLWMKANGFTSWDTYSSCERSGRGANPRLTKEQRRTIYLLFNQYNVMLKEKFRDHLDLEDYALLLLRNLDDIPIMEKYDYIFVDEVQDLQAMQLKSLISLQTKSIVVSGDPKQRIYKRSPFSYKELGLNIEGKRNRTLRTNYRSTKQIMQLAGRIEFDDEENDRYDHQNFVREGPVPLIKYFPHSKLQNRYLVKQIKEVHQRDPGATVAIIHRHDHNENAIRDCEVYDALRREFNIIKTSGYAEQFDFNQARKPIFYTDAFSVKGLEFDYVFIIHFDREHYPNQVRIDELDQRSDGKRDTESYDRDYNEIFNDEKKLLYVAMTRAKKELQLFYTSQKPISISQMVRDFDGKGYIGKGFVKSKFRK